MRPAELLVRRAAEHPDRTFLRTRAGDLSYQQLADAATGLANGLAELGARTGTPVALLMHNSADHVACTFAISELAGVCVPLNTALTGPSLVHTLRLTSAPIIVVDAALLPNLIAVLDELPAVRHIVVRGRPTADAGRRPLLDLDDLPSRVPHAIVGEADDLAAAMMLFTSGTTGPSKACVLSHRYLIRQAQWHVEHLALTAADVLYCPTPLFHVDAATLTVLAALTTGGVAAIGERFSASRFWDEVIAFDATVFNFMGATLTILWKQDPGPRDRQHRVRLAWGVPMPDWHAEWQQRFGFRLAELYGLTDAGVVAYDPIDEPHRPGACGRVIAQYEVAIADERGDLLPIGSPGEILIRPREPGTIMTEYFAMPVETLAAFRGLWFHTGDLGRLDADGYLYFLGRSKDSIRRRGENISAYEVEQLVTGHPAVLEAAAIGVPSELTEEDVKVCVVLRPAARLDPADLITYCTANGAPFMVPRYVEIVAALPKTPTLKVEKFRLRDAGITPTTWDRDTHPIERTSR